MKTIKVLRGVLHVPSASWAPTFIEVGPFILPTGNRDIRVVRPGETIELADIEADRLIERRVAIEAQL